jgi:peptidoglycan/LPS O-acetylase OafA/YrhL
VFRGAGYLGVDFFFTLSGFLITSLLIADGRFDLPHFYKRRALRIVPLYWAMASASYLVLPFMMSHQLSLPPVGYILSFTANLFYAAHMDNYLFAIMLLWSLSVEMQFYLVWGFLLRFFKPHLYQISASLIIVSLLLKYLLCGKYRMYFMTTTYVPDFMIGAIGAKMLYEQRLDFASIHRGLKFLLYLMIAAVFVFTPFLNTFFWWKIFSDTIYSALALCIIIDQCCPGSLFEAGRSKVISYLGKVSYGIYCFQGFVLPIYTKKLLPHFLGSGALLKVFVIPSLLFIITGLLASFSYHYFESKFLRLTERVDKPDYRC